MTRKKAKELFRNDKDSYGKPKAIMAKIDKIYDDFMQEIDGIYKATNIISRTCSNCKYYSYKEGHQPDGMLWEIEDCAIYSNVVPELIDREGCNRWEKQDERRI